MPWAPGPRPTPSRAGYFGGFRLFAGRAREVSRDGSEWPAVDDNDTPRVRQLASMDASDEPPSPRSEPTWSPSYRLDRFARHGRPPRYVHPALPALARLSGGAPSYRDGPPVPARTISIPQHGHLGASSTQWPGWPSSPGHHFRPCGNLDGFRKFRRRCWRPRRVLMAVPPGPVAGSRRQLQRRQRTVGARPTRCRRAARRSSRGAGASTRWPRR